MLSFKEERHVQGIWLFLPFLKRCNRDTGSGEGTGSHQEKVQKVSRTYNPAISEDVICTTVRSAFFYRLLGHRRYLALPCSGTDAVQHGDVIADAVIA